MGCHATDASEEIQRDEPRRETTVCKNNMPVLAAERRIFDKCVIEFLSSCTHLKKGYELIHMTTQISHSFMKYKQFADNKCHILIYT